MGDVGEEGGVDGVRGECGVEDAGEGGEGGGGGVGEGVEGVGHCFWGGGWGGGWVKGGKRRVREGWMGLCWRMGAMGRDREVGGMTLLSLRRSKRCVLVW